MPKRGRPALDKPKQIRLSTYVDESVAKVAIEHADSLNQSISEYLGNILMMYLSKYSPEEFKARYY